MEKPPFTPEQLRWLEENQASGRTRNTAWTPLKNEISDFINNNYGKNPKAYSLDTAIKTIIRFHLGVSNVYQINDDNIVEARKMFELLKAHI